jgi:outer membrane receptor for ferrienterochelin and colicins
MYRICRTYWWAAAAALFVFVSSTSPALAQGDALIRGQASAAADGSVLPAATVTLTSRETGTKRQAITDANGAFVFAAVVPGEYLLSLAIDGFAPRDLRFTLAPREVRTLAVALDVARLNVDVSVTAADERALRGTHSPSSTVLTEHDLEALPPFQRSSLPEAIVTSAPGMIRGHDDFVHVRGHEIALNPLINGVSFWENTHPVFSAGLSPDVIETASVMTGGFPAEYGNRFGGVVDVVTKSGHRMDDRGSVTMTAGDAGRRRLDGEMGGRRGALGYYVFGSLFESDRFLSPPDPRAIHDAARGGHAFVHLDGETDLGMFSAVVSGDGTNAEIPRTPADVELRPAALPTQRTRQQTAIVGWSRAASNLVLTASGYQRWSRLRLLPAEGPLTAQAQLTRELTTVGAKADATRLAGRHTMKAGVDVVSLRPDEDLAYSYEGYRELTHLLGLPHIHVGEPVIAFSGRERGGQTSLFAQDTIQLGDRTTADLGVRVDRHALVVTETHVSPRVNLAVRAGGASVLHASYNHFFVPPAIEGVLSSSAGLTRSIREIDRTLPALRATTEDQFEAGGWTPLGPFGVSLTAYYRATDNPVHTTVWPDSRIYSYASFDRARAYGLEARAELSAPVRYGLTGYLNYALGRVDFSNPVTGGFVTDAGHLTATNRFLAPMDQTHTMSGAMTYRHAASGVWAGTGIEFGSGTPIGHGDDEHAHAAGEEEHAHASGAGSARVPAHVVGNVSVGIDLLRGTASRPRLVLRLDVENVANDAYVIAREGEFSPAQYSIPRLLSLSARIAF